jgi:hypothetical protein
MRKTLTIISILALLLSGLGLLVFAPTAAKAAPECDGQGEVCTGYDVKIDVPDDGGTAIYDGPEAYITVSAEQVTWQAKEGYEIVDTCMKEGGQGGGVLIHPPVEDGVYYMGDHEISHAAFNFSTVETPEPTTETPEPTTETPEPTTETPEPTTETPEPTTETPEPTTETPEPTTETPEPTTETPEPTTETPEPTTETPEPTTETPEPTTETPAPTEQPIQPDPDLGVGDWIPFIGGGTVLLALGWFLKDLHSRGKLPLKKSS